MNIADNKTTALTAPKLREPIYASVWLALFASLRQEFSQSRIYNQI
jgi:hypothetical protein